MKSELVYNSTGQNAFDSWRIWFFTLLVVAFITRSFWLGLAVSSFLVFAIIAYRTSTIRRKGQELHCSSLSKSTTIKKIDKIETWWSYDFGTSTQEIGDDTSKSRAHINYMRVYAEISGDENSVIIFELIQLSSKFPGNHIYNQNRSIDHSDIYKVWDVDKCLAKLNLSSDAFN